MNMIDVNRRVTRITVGEISAVAAQGVARALEAGRAQGIDLTKDEIDRVIGGVIGGLEPWGPDWSPENPPYPPLGPETVGFEPPSTWPEEPESGSIDF